MQRILIVDGSEDFRYVLSRALEKQYRVDCCSEGESAFALLRRERFEMMIVDTLLPGSGGLDLLQRANDAGVCPRVIVAAPDVNDYILAALGRFGVDYVFQKPCPVDAIVSRVRDLLSQSTTRILPLRQTPHDAASTLLYELTIPTNYAGFDQGRIALILLAENGGKMAMKALYPEVAKRSAYGGDASTVERNIRSAIAAGYARRDDAVWAKYFHPAPNGEIPRPTNTQFLTRLAEEIARCAVLQAE